MARTSPNLDSGPARLRRKGRRTAGSAGRLEVVERVRRRVSLPPHALRVALAALLCEAISFGGVNPFGLAFGAAVLFAGAYSLPLAAMAGSLLAGVLLGRTAEALLGTLVPLGVVALASRLPRFGFPITAASRMGAGRLLRATAWTAAAAMGGGLLYRWLAGDHGSLVVLPSAGVASGFAACLLRPGARILAGRPRPARQAGSLAERAACLALFALALAGIGELGAGGPVPAALAPALGWWAVLSSAWMAGAGAGAVVGAATGVALAFAPGLRLVDLAVFAPAGLLAGTVSHKEGKAEGVLAALAGLLIVFSLAGQLHDGPLEPAPLASGAYLLAGAVLFALSPRRWLYRLSSRLNLLLRPEPELSALRSARERLEDLSRVFREISSQVGDAEERDEGAREWAEEVSRRACHGCPLFQRCWKELQYSTFWDVVQLLALAERRGRIRPVDFPPGLGGRCIAKPRVANTVNQVAAWFRSRQGTERAGSAREPLAGQLAAVSHLLSLTARRLSAGDPRDEILSRRIATSIAAAGLRPVAVRVSQGEGGCPQARVRLRREPGPEELQRLISATSRAVGLPMILIERRPRSDFARPPVTELLLVARPQVRFRWAAALRPKEGGESGDRVLEVPLGHGRRALLLADGMGSGRRAALESEIALLTIGRLLQVGLGPEAALRLGNSLLARRKAAERFTALDLAILDEFTGEVELMKCGSPPSFLRRGRRVKALQWGGPPIGIVDPVEVVPKKLRLGPGDLLALVTDGLLEADAEVRNKEEWISQFVLDVPGPTEEAARELLGRAADSGRAPEDDMSVLLIGGTGEGGSLSEEIPEYTRQVRSFRPMPPG